MSGRLSDFLYSQRLAPAVPGRPAGQLPTLSGTTIVSASGCDGSFNYAVGAYYDITIIGAKIGWSIVEEQEVRKIRSDFYVAPSESRAQFVKAESSLDCFGIAVLENEHGAGKRSDAIRLLCVTAEEGGAILELSPDWEGQPTTKDLPRVRNSRLLLDLTPESDELTEQFGRQLIDYGRELKQLGSQIVITVTPRVWTRCRLLLNEHTVNLAPRDPERIIKSHIAYRDDSLKALDLFDKDPLKNLLKQMRDHGASPDEMVRLAERLIHAQPDDLNRIVDEHNRWASYISKQLDCRQHGWANRRILLITVVVLNGATCAAVAGAWPKLAQKLGFDTVPLYRALESEGWTTRLREIGADVQDDRVWVDLNKPGADCAVVEWLWREQPGLREAFLDWIAILASDAATRKYAGRLAAVLARLVSVFRSLEILDKLYSWIKECHGKKGGSHRRELAEEALKLLLIDQKACRLTQGRLWQWVYRGSPAAFASLAQLCGGSFGMQYPQVALARLRHLAARADSPEAQLAVSTTLRSLAAQEILRQMVVDKAVEWTRDGAAARAGFLALTALFDPQPEDAVVVQLVEAAAGDSRMLELLGDAWLMFTAQKEQTRVEEIVRYWSRMRDEGILDADAVMRIWEPMTKEILFDQPKAKLIEAMTDRTRADAVTFTVSQMSAVKYGHHESPHAPTLFSPTIGRGDHSPSGLPDWPTESTSTIRAMVQRPTPLPVHDASSWSVDGAD